MKRVNEVILFEGSFGTTVWQEELQRFGIMSSDSAPSGKLLNLWMLGLYIPSLPGSFLWPRWADVNVLYLGEASRACTLYAILPFPSDTSPATRQVVATLLPRVP